MFEDRYELASCYDNNTDILSNPWSVDQDVL